MEVELVAVTPDAERVIEVAARTCYQSQDRGGDSGRFLPKLLAAGHESPFEHAYATFRIAGCSRAMSHQLVRHRLMAVSQKSQRYVSEANFEYAVPPAIAPEDRADFHADMEAIRQMYARWRSRGLRSEDARFVLPNACATEIVVSADFREWRHIIRVRCSRHAQWEIRAACLRILAALCREAPSVFEDLAREVRDELGESAEEFLGAEGA
jgi:thymidylate synthase (FAD)